MNGFCSIALRWFILLAACCVIASGQASPTPAAASVSQSYQSLLPRCAQIAAAGPQFAPLAGACQFAFSPVTLPNFVCQETIERFISNSGPKEWQHLDLLTAEAMFEHGKGEHYSNFTMNGHPIHQLTRRHSWSEIANYFIRLPDPFGFIATHFGNDLGMVFASENRATFEYKGEVNVTGTTLAVFALRIKKAGPWASDDHPAVGWGGDRAETALQGFIWISKNTSLLARMVLHYTDIDPDFPVSSSAAATDYRLVPIAGLGQFLLPTGGEDMGCDHSNQCWRNVSTFHDCHKFAAESRILPKNETK
ncbi:MAG: hypothetical protein DMG60_11910 [Acidobacteria bacterium]|nr:MAG: hypothetical protein DMG60_11910 [Acidobacteriota bacterium]